MAPRQKCNTAKEEAVESAHLPCCDRIAVFLAAQWFCAERSPSMPRGEDEASEQEPSNHRRVAATASRPSACNCGTSATVLRIGPPQRSAIRFGSFRHCVANYRAKASLPLAV